jgi:high affinity Mn2+ porin
MARACDDYDAWRWRTTVHVALASALAGAAACFGAATLAQTTDPTQTPDAPADSADAAMAPQAWAAYGQVTVVEQGYPTFRSAFQGPNSLSAGGQARETGDITAVLGLRLWSGAQAWINPEIDQGFGLSDTLGIAGFTSGEAYKVGRTAPYIRLPRLFIRQTIDLGGERQSVAPDLNQLGGTQSADRLVITAGKFSVTDIFDTNSYAHDPRNDFLNWALIDTGTFDYAADAWGYTYGAAVEWYVDRWTLRTGLFDLSDVPNSETLENGFKEFQVIAEVEERHQLWGRPGALRITGFLSDGRMGSFADAIQLAQASGGQPANIAAVRHFQTRGGVSLNLEQEVADGVGVFARAGLADGGVEPYEFTDIDRTVAAGVSLNGKRWGRADDTLGLAGVVNGISKIHQQFLADGGLGVLVGDGQLPHPGPEAIVETYYELAADRSIHLTLDYQFVNNPAYNRDRGPISVFAARVHAQF